ncbi:MAG: 50S ribosomal protein L29 [Proteobacteria bacterium]|nr:50S ribosomal protein L29 [Pseudomonadota bacterium]
MKAKEMRELTVEELNQREKDLKAEYFNLKFQLATNQLTSSAKLSQVKKDIARIKTIVCEKEKAH